MKKIIYTFFAISIFAFVTMSNSAGRAGVGGAGATSASGEGTACQNCHNGGSFGTNVTIKLFEKGTSTEIIEYVPGTVYDAAVQISTTTTPSGFGFQALVLQDSDNSAINAWANNSTTNTQVSTANGRQYFEQQGMASDNVMKAEWTAPAAGAGDVSFYLVGNAVNGNGATSSDDVANKKITFSEFVNSTSKLELLGISLDVFPNPTVDNLFLNINTEDVKDFSINIYDLNGKRLETKNVTVQNGENRFNFDVSAFANGIYFIEINNGEISTSQRFVKF
jgi:hypothetical protein